MMPIGQFGKGRAGEYSTTEASSTELELTTDIAQVAISPIDITKSGNKGIKIFQFDYVLTLHLIIY